MAEIPKIVAQRLRGFDKPQEHPDSNLLAAFAERSLTKSERLQVLSHVSQCANCREVVSTSTTQPAMATAVSPVAGSGWLSWPALRWGAAAACMVVVGTAVTLHLGQVRQIAGYEQRTSGPNTPTAKNISGTPDKPSSSTEMPAPAAPIVNQAVAADKTVPGRAKDAGVESLGLRKTTGIADKAPPEAALNLPPRWALSPDGTLQCSRDSGATWETVPVPSHVILRALAANGRDIWVGGMAGALFHSSDAGRHWIQVRPVVNGEILAADVIGVEFTDLLHGRLTIAGPRNPNRSLQQYTFSADSNGDVEAQELPGPAASSAETWSTADAGQTWQKR